jgi:DNA polymerase-3 subunit epsilon
MAEGVVVANEMGEAILMNPRARLALGSGPASGIGSPLSRTLPADRLAFHLKRLRKDWDEGQETVEDVVFPLPEGALLKGFVSVVPGPEGQRAGFLLVFRDISAKAEQTGKTEEALREMPELLRGPLATAGSLVEALERHPDMPEAKQGAFLAAVREEIGRVADRLQVVEQAAAAAESSRWPGVPADPRELLEEAVASVPGVFARVELPDDGVAPVLVEPFSWVASLACVLRWMAEQSTGWAPVGALLRAEAEAVVTAFRVDHDLDVDPARLEALEVAPLGEVALPLGEAVRRNRGELWTRSSDGAFEVCLGLMRASVSPARTTQEGIADQQPEFYDFDLFLPRPSFEAEEMLNATLETLEYVVFDSETTGLHPSKGDRVVSLSAIRVRRGKIQSADTFHTLVNPGRPIPPESTGFHGIGDGEVKDAPAMGGVLRRFYEYAGNSVLVAHNAAFDKKFLDLAASQEGLPLLENPILDTLFLSYGIHKDFEGHNLEAIAARLGIEVEGRHTSLGDANTTAEIFLRLISLLAARGVETLGQAKAFCDRMLLLRWQSSRF